jgi:Holliday junction resolvase-like predicted endonuclease
MESLALTWRQRIGLRAEDAAAAHLRALGAQVLLRNYRCRCGELDIVARVGEEELALVRGLWRSGGERRRR